jgi:hypothetical protein
MRLVFTRLRNPILSVRSPVVFWATAAATVHSSGMAATDRATDPSRTGRRLDPFNSGRLPYR